MSQDRTYHKIIFAGLDAVGKTSIYKSVIENVDVDGLRDLEPTRGIERKYHKFGDNQLVFWDLGGQEAYRSKYFQDPRVFQDISLLLYVLDIQDIYRFDDSIEYLLQILMTLKNLDQAPRIVVLIHKYDPERRSQFQYNLLEAAKVLRETSKFPSIEITKFATSIYSDNLDSIVENIIKEVIPDYSNKLLQPEGMVRKITFDEAGKPISSTEFTTTAEKVESDFQNTLAEHFRILKDMLDKKDGEPDSE
ncbi:MAG: ADP-ribosylation factor-like protein [Candidatus Kariarchaeaceae archaeon]|jgi:GTPase SAR1 family protein